MLHGTSWTRGSREFVRQTQMSRFSRRSMGVAIFALLSVSCGPRPKESKVPLAPPQESTTLGPGDTFLLEVVGEKDLPSEFQVASDGSVDLPFLNRVQVAGLEPQEVAERVRKGLIEAQILVSPSVVVRVKDYRSKRIVVLGQVRKPGSFPFQAGMTLVQSVSAAGGVTAIGAQNRVRLTRQTTDGKSQTAVIDLEAINAGISEDVLLQSGDRVFVDERVF